MSSHYKSKIIATAPKFPAVLSILGSSIIIRKVVSSPEKRKDVYHRIMFGLSCCDIIASLNYFTGTWLIPKGQVGGLGPVFMASGSKATCSLSGFFTNFAVASPLYNGTLAWYYLLSIHQNWSDRKIRKIEKWFHIIPIAFAIVSSSIALGFDMYGNVDWLCWILPDVPEGEEPTNAQKNFRIFQWMFLFGPVWLTVAFVTTVMVLLFFKMKENEKNMEKYRYSTPMVRASICSTPGLSNSTSKLSTSNNDANNSSVSFATTDWRALKKSGVSATKKVIRDSHNSSVSFAKSDWRALKKSSVSTTKEAVDDIPTEGWRRLKKSGAKMTKPQGDVEEGTSFDEKKTSNQEELGDNHDSQEARGENGDQNGNDDNDNDSSVSSLDGSNEEEDDISNNDNDEDEDDDEDLSLDNTFEDEEAVNNYESEDFLPNLEESFDRSNCNNPQARNGRERGVSFAGSVEVALGQDDDEKSTSKVSEKKIFLRDSSFVKSAKRLWSRVSSRNSETIGSLRSSQRSRYNQASKSRQIAIQGMLYVCAFYITWLFPTLQRITELAVSKNFYVLVFFDTFLLPLQGIINAAIYIRPRLARFRRNNPDLGFWKSVLKVAYEV